LRKSWLWLQAHVNGHSYVIMMAFALRAMHARMRHVDNAGMLHTVKWFLGVPEFVAIMYGQAMHNKSKFPLLQAFDVLPLKIEQAAISSR
jgi:hypothetical protein